MQSSRAYSGNSDLADALAEHEEDIRQPIGGNNGFKAYYLLQLAEGSSTISIFENRKGLRIQVALPPCGWLRTFPDLNVATRYITAGNVLVGF